MGIEVKLPEMGEGIASGDVVRVLVKPGDSVNEGQGLLELETDKALIEVPSDAAGVVETINFKQGDKVPVGAVVAILSGSNGTSTKPAETKAGRSKGGKVQASEPAVAPPAVSNGVGLKPKAALLPQSQAALASGAAVAPVSDVNVPAGPATRRIARELGIELSLVQGSGPGGRVYQSDVLDYVRSSRGGTSAALGAKPLPDFSKWGEVRREAYSKVRAKTAEQMALCWATIPHVTQYERADITELEAMRARQEAAFDKQGGKLSFTVLALRAVVTALKAYPKFNASIDTQRGEIVYKDYVHLGIAVDTERGLLVPVLRDADKLDILGMARELPALAERARSGRIDLAELQGASFTISNQGGIGGAEFSPIVNWPEVAILGIGRARLEAGINPRSAALEARLMCPLALSYDHRIIDGAEAARWIRLLKELLEDPERLLLGV
jgi:pyruvate dehydrogenase E2 component (dihydrolipoamide acetyltransferase)